MEQPDNCRVDQVAEAAPVASDPEKPVETSLPPPTPRPTILVVDDMDGGRIMMKWFLTSFNYEVTTARSAEEALSLFDPKVHSLVLTDNSMPGMKGAELAQFVKMRSPSTLVLMYTGKPPRDRTYLDFVIQKPAHLLAIKYAIDKLLRPEGSKTPSRRHCIHSTKLQGHRSHKKGISELKRKKICRQQAT